MYIYVYMGMKPYGFCFCKSFLFIKVLQGPSKFLWALQDPSGCAKPLKAHIVFSKHPHICRKKDQNVYVYMCTKPLSIGAL